MTESIIIVALVFGVCIWAIVATILDNAKSNADRDKVRFNLQFIRIGMTIEEVVSILGSGKKINYLQGLKIKQQYDKNHFKDYFSKDQFMESDPYYSIRVPEGYICLFYGGSTYTYSTDGYKGTDTRTYWGISLYFKNGILEYTE